MICDQLRNSAVYEAMSPAFQKAFQYLKTVTMDNLPGNRYEIDGDHIFAFSSTYDTLPAAERKLEAHRSYLDIQYVVAGVEAMGYIPTEGLEAEAPYKPDIVLYNTNQDVLIPAQAGTFMVFFPQDGHRPGCTWNVPSPVTKVIVKVAVDAL